MIRYIYSYFNQPIPVGLEGVFYNLFTVLAAVVFALLIFIQFKRSGLSLKDNLITIGILTVTNIVLADLGQRVAGIFYKEPAFMKPIFILITFITKPTKTYHGAIVLIIIWSIIYCKLMFKNKWKTPFDILALYLPLAHAIGRFSCFFAGCCWGHELGVCVPGTSVHFHNPIPLYESAFNILIFLTLLFIFKKIHPNPDKGITMEEQEKKLSPKQKVFSGVILPVYMVMYGIWRFFIENIRSNPKILCGLTQAQIVMSVFIITGLTIILIKLSKSQRT